MSEGLSAEKKLTVKVDEGDKLTIDGAERRIEELKADFFEDLVDKALANKVDFVLESDGIVGNFFKTIQTGTAAGSELHKLYERTLADNKISDEDDSISSDVQGTKLANGAVSEVEES